MLGDIGVVYIPAKMRCEKCGRRDYVEAIFFHPVGAEWHTLKIRRLVGVKLVRKVIWQDD
jgi:hypothetical protein